MMRFKPLDPPVSVSYLIVFCVVAVEALNLALLWIALRGNISRVVRPLVAACGVSGAWGAWVLALVLRTPLWMVALTGTVLAVGSVAMGMAIHLATVEEKDRDDGGGGGAPVLLPSGPGGGPDDEPPWWPEFERELEAFAAQRDREPQTADC